MAMFWILFAIFSILIYLYYQQKFRFWKNRGFPYIEPIFPFGNVSECILKNEPVWEFFQEHYMKTKKAGGRYIGIYFFSRPQLLIIDPELTKRILLTDNQYFPGRGIYHNEEADPLSASLIALEGEKWKNARAKLTPTFSSGKLKNMFQIIFLQAQELVKQLENQKEVEIKELISRYGIDVIGSCAWGVDCNSLRNPDSKFREYGRKVFDETYLDMAKRIFLRSYPNLARKLNMTLLKPEVTKFFMKTFLDNVNYRKTTKFERKDFLQLLIELIELENAGKDGFSMNEAAAQAFIFFVAGFETSATTMSFAMFELATNLEIQDRLRAEICAKMAKTGGELTYNDILEMTYMDQIIQETLRKWSTFPFLFRRCNQDYKIPDSNHTIPKGVFVFIPTYAIHRDPEIYPDPRKFDPERFANEDILKSLKNNYSYLPFGGGPRICIGLRFALIQIKLALSLILHKYKITLNEKTQVPFEYSSNPITMNIKNNIWLNLEPVK